MAVNLPPMVMPWVKPDPLTPRPNQEKAAFQNRLVDHNAHLTVDSMKPPYILTTIICTLGPNTKEEDILDMLKAGMGVIRIDMCNKLWARDLIHRSRRAIERYSNVRLRPTPIAFALDLKGPFILTGKLKNRDTVTLVEGDSLRLTTHPGYDESGSEEVIYVDHKTLHQIVVPGTKIVLDNGRIELNVRGVVDNDIVCEVICGGVLGHAKRVLLPGTAVDTPDLTSEDWEAISMAKDEDVQAIFLPCSVSRAMMEQVKETLVGKRISLFIKIESRCCYDTVENIISYSDGIIINRGAMSVEMSTEKVVQAQKSIIAKCNKAGIPVYVMTDFLSSMKLVDCPTIAEVADVSSAILDGIDGLILGEETSLCSRPGHVVKTLATLCKEAESEIWQTELSRTFSSKVLPPTDPVNALCLAAVETSLKANAGAILVCSTSGLSAKLLALFRPRCPIISVTRYGAVARNLVLYRGIWPVHYIYPVQPCWQKDVDRRFHCAVEYAKRESMIRPGDLLVLISSWRQGAGFTNQLRIVYASNEQDRWVMPSAAVPRERLDRENSQAELEDLDENKLKTCKDI